MSPTWSCVKICVDVNHIFSSKMPPPRKNVAKNRLNCAKARASKHQNNKENTCLVNKPATCENGSEFVPSVSKICLGRRFSIAGRHGNQGSKHNMAITSPPLPPQAVNNILLPTSGMDY